MFFTLRRKANARNVSYTSNPTEHTISTFVDQIRIQFNRQFRKKTVFIKTSLPVFFDTSLPICYKGRYAMVTMEFLEDIGN